MSYFFKCLDYFLKFHYFLVSIDPCRFLRRSSTCLRSKGHKLTSEMREQLTISSEQLWQKQAVGH